MNIRSKLLVLLLLISLTPLLFVGIGQRNDLTRLGEGLAERSSSALMNNARRALKRIVEDHARILLREKQLLESSAWFLASRIEGILYGHEHFSPSTASGLPSAQILETRKEYALRHMHGIQNLDADLGAMDIVQPASPLSAERREIFQTMLLPLLKSAKAQYPQLILWMHLRLTDRTEITYPKSQARMYLRDQLYFDEMETSHSKELTWSRPQTDARTRKAVFHVTAPIRDAQGVIRGDITLVVPVSALLHKSPHLGLFSDSATSFFVREAIDPATSEDRLQVIAREDKGQSAYDQWDMPGAETWISPENAQGYAHMMATLRESTSGVTDMPHDGEDALWAYAPLEPGGTALLVLVPRADIVRAALTAKEFIFAQVGTHTRRLGLVVLAVAAAVFALALYASALFTRDISRLAAAVRLISGGDFSARADVRGSDEIGELGKTFNLMVPELQERIGIKNALEVAQQVQQNLLPASPPRFHGYDIAAMSEYCHETGGDYYDFIRRETPEGQSLVVAIGDVSGHGIPAALMMASARAYIRGNLASGERLDEAVRRANTLITEDTNRTGRFMTLFLLELTEGGLVRWVRAGHDPALVYSPADDAFEELVGQGLPVGVIRDAGFDLNERRDLSPGRIVVVSTDGIWETCTPGGEMFGKARLREIIRAHRDEPAEAIIRAVTQALGEFRGSAALPDDMTIAVVKTP